MDKPTRNYMKTKQAGNVALWAIFLIVVIGVLVAAVMYGNNQSESTGAEISQEETIDILALRENDHTKGAEMGEVVIVEYSDFQCPACKSFATVIDDILAEQGENVTFVYRHLPLRQIHPNADLAARAAEAAGEQNAFFPMHDLLFERQSEWSNERNPRSTFVSYAEELELDIDAFAEAINSTENRTRVNNDYQDGETLLGGPQRLATPSIFVNGERVTGAALGRLDQVVAALVASASETTEEEEVVAEDAE